MRLSVSLVSAAFLSFVVADSLDTSSSPIVTLPYGSFRGKADGTTAQFLGMPFAAPPYVVGLFSNSHLYTLAHSTGERRFGFPEPPIPLTGIRDAMDFGAPCSQQTVTFPVPPLSKNMSEDCTTNSFRPS